MDRCYGPCWILVGFVLRAPFLYTVSNLHVLGSRLGAHTRWPQENPCIFCQTNMDPQ